MDGQEGIYNEDAEKVVKENGFQVLLDTYDGRTYDTI